VNRWLLVLAVAATVSGCAGPGEGSEPDGHAALHTDGHLSRSASGDFSVDAALATCTKDDWVASCSMTLPMRVNGQVEVGADATRGILTVSWEEGAGTPPDWVVRMTLEDGGTWGWGCGRSPLRVPLASPLPAGTYTIDGWPNQEHVGPLRAVLHWRVDYDEGPRYGDEPPYDITAGGCDVPT
jgi:hypothetical protein